MFDLKKVSLDIFDKLRYVSDGGMKYTTIIKDARFELEITFKDIEIITFTYYSCQIDMNLFVDGRHSYYQNLIIPKFDIRHPEPNHYNIFLEGLNLLFTNYFKNSLKYCDLVNKYLLDCINNLTYKERFKDPNELININKTKYKTLNYYNFKIVEDGFLPTDSIKGEVLEELNQMDSFTFDNIGKSRLYNIVDMLDGNDIVTIRILGDLKDVIELIKTYVVSCEQYNYYYDSDKTILYVFSPLVLVDVIINNERTENSNFNYNHELDLEIGFLKQIVDATEQFFWNFKRAKNCMGFKSIENVFFYNSKNGVTTSLF